MDFSGCVISKDLGPAPVKLVYSSFSAEIQIKQSFLAKQNPLQSYFPLSVWPGKIQGDFLFFFFIFFHFNPEAFSYWEILDEPDWQKHAINTLSRPFLNLSTSSVWLSEKLHLTLYLSQQESCFTTSAHPTLLSEQPSWTVNICFVVSLLFPPIICSDTFHLYW